MTWIELSKLKNMLYEEEIPKENIRALTLFIDENGRPIKSNSLEEDRRKAVAELSIVRYRETTPEKHLLKKLSSEFERRLEKLLIKKDVNISLAPYLGICINLNWVARESPVEAYIFDPSLRGEEKYVMSDRLGKCALTFSIKPSPSAKNEYYMILNSLNENTTSIERFQVETIRDGASETLRRSFWGIDCIIDYKTKLKLFGRENYHQVIGKGTVYGTRCGVSRHDFATMAQVFIPPYDEKNTVFI